MSLSVIHHHRLHLLLLLLHSALVICEGCYSDGERSWECKNFDDCTSEDKITAGTECSDRQQVCCPEPWPSGYFASKYCLKSQVLCSKQPGLFVYPTKSEEDGVGDQRVLVRETPTIKQYPHLVSIGYYIKQNITWFCGGTIINEYYVLTSAMCVTNIPKSRKLIVRVGETDYARENEDALPQDLEVRSIFVHPEFRAPAIYADIALIRLADEMIFSEYVRPACLHLMPKVPYRAGIIAGWGRTAKNYISSIGDGVVYLMNDTLCDTLKIKPNTRYPEGIKMEQMVCSKKKVEGPNSCVEDRGGPLMIKMSGRCLMTVAGIVSFTDGCNAPKSPEMYTRISFFIPWIENIVWNNLP